MKYAFVYIVALICLSCGSLWAQDQTLFKKDEVDSLPKLNLENNKYWEYLCSHYYLSDSILSTGIAGEISYSFIIEKDGSVNSITILNGLSSAQNNELIRVIASTSKKWKPAMKRKSSVRFQYEGTQLFHKELFLPDTSLGTKARYFRTEDVPAKLKEGDLIKWIVDNYTISEKMFKHGKGGKITLTFTIQTDGSLTDLRILAPLTPLQDAEAIRVIQSTSGNWLPGSLNNHLVPCRFSQSFLFDDYTFR